MNISLLRFIEDEREELGKIIREAAEKALPVFSDRKYGWSIVEKPTIQLIEEKYWNLLNNLAYHDSDNVSSGGLSVDLLFEEEDMAILSFGINRTSCLILRTEKGWKIDD